MGTGVGEVRAGSEAKGAVVMTALLEVRGLSKRFGGLTAVDDLSFELERGRIMGLIGPNGAGKTTVFNLVSGRFPPTSGDVLFKGMSVRRVPPHRRVHMGMVRTFQSTTLYHDATVFENVIRGCAARQRSGFWSSLPGTRAAREDQNRLRDRALELIDFVELSTARDDLARNLPYGHQRALGVAIGLATEPELIMLDEPVAGMNPGETAQMARLIQRVNESGTTVLVVEHDMSFVMNLCQRIVVISNGKKIAEGTPDVVQRHPDVVQAYLGGDDDVTA